MEQFSYDNYSIDLTLWLVEKNTYVTHSRPTATWSITFSRLRKFTYYYIKSHSLFPLFSLALIGLLSVFTTLNQQIGSLRKWRGRKIGEFKQRITLGATSVLGRNVGDSPSHRFLIVVISKGKENPISLSSHTSNARHDCWLIVNLKHYAFYNDCNSWPSGKILSPCTFVPTDTLFSEVWGFFC